MARSFCLILTLIEFQTHGGRMAASNQLAGRPESTCQLIEYLVELDSYS